VAVLIDHSAVSGMSVAIHGAVSSMVYLSEKISVRIAKIFSNRHPGASKGSPLALLSRREFDVFKLLGLGLTIN
jgi:DNA-binding NarL/FixJ family response regulator